MLRHVIPLITLMAGIFLLEFFNADKLMNAVITLLMFNAFITVIFPAKKTKVFIIEGNIDDIFAKISDYINTANAKIIMLDKTNYVLEVKKPMTWSSFGETIKLQLSSLKENKINMQITSESCYAIFDDNQNDLNIKELENLLQIDPCVNAYMR